MAKPDLKPPLEAGAAFEYAGVQTIAFNTKDVNVIFCPIFNELRDRLYRVLRPNILIYSGVSPTEFEDMLNEVYDARDLSRAYASEVDIRKYDKSQDFRALVFDASIMRAFGVSKHYVDLWFNAHVRSVLHDKYNGIPWVLTIKLLYVNF